MKRVSQFVKNNNSYAINLDTDPIYNDKKIQEFIRVNNISNDIFLKQYKVFYDFYIINSKPELFNITPVLVYKNDIVEIKYKETDEVRAQREAKKLKNLVKTAYISNSILKARFSEMKQDKSERNNLAEKLILSAYNYIKGKDTRGIYVYGKTGIGKTYMMGALYNYLKNEGKEPAIIYFPELIRKVKAGISNGTSNDIVDAIREQEILIIDDIGAENITDYVRDEVLVPIINYRSDEKLLTYFTSNLGLAELKSFLEITKEAKDETKAIRLIRRIRDLAEVEFLDI